MAILDIFSKRQKRMRGDIIDVYTYDSIPNELKVQIINIVNSAFDVERHGYDENVVEAFKFIVKALCQEYGVFCLPPMKGRYSDDWAEELYNYLLAEQDVEKCIDVIELTFRYLDRVVREYRFLRNHNADENVSAAIDELNQRFKEHGIGYQYVDGEVFRIDSELIHVEAVKPALRLLNTNEYNGPQNEFISAYDHYRNGKNKEALNDCLKCFESTMKAICDKQGWSYKAGDTAKTLIEICLKNDLVPSFWQTKLTSLRSLLESSIPTGRNKLSGHGQGSVPSTVPDHIAAYMLHMTASTVVFLVSAEEALSKAN